MGELRIPVEIARKWHGLADRQRSYLVQLYRTGRWSRHFNQESFRLQMIATTQSVEAWAAVVQQCEQAGAAD
jgi:hypothetical protein